VDLSFSSWGVRYQCDHKSLFWTYGGKDPCRFLKGNYVPVLDYIIKTVYFDFPDRNDRRLNIGDATPISGPCSGHPGGSHQGLRSVDFDYYTLGENNVTQYKPECIEEKTIIWDDDTLINFDWERNYILWKRIKEAFPDVRILTDIIILQYMLEMISKHYGYEESINFDRYVSGNSHGMYNHHTHVHVFLGRKINWDAKF
jgi:hypothetical protein